MSFLIWLVTRGAAVLVGLYALHRLALWAEGKGWLYYRNTSPKPGGLRGAALEMERFIRPSIEHRVEAEDAVVESQEDDGE